MKSKEEIDELIHKIIDCAIAVHRVLRTGFQEEVFHRALSIEFRHQSIEFQREMEMELFYRKESIVTRRVDCFVQCKVIVEQKACPYKY